MSGRLETLLERDRLLVAGALVLVSGVCWAWLLAGAGMDMNGLDMTRHSLMGMDMMAAPSWDGSYLLLMFSMWWIMMIAMMLPSASPVILLSAALNRRAAPGEAPFGSAVMFSLGYLTCWGLFSAAAVAAQWLLQSFEWIGGMMQSRNRVLTAAILLAAGAWQFTPWKRACLRQCRGPVEFLTRYRQPGNRGAFMMGARHGLYCLGCCWFLMLLLFVGGVMNLVWIAGLALYVWVEKVTSTGELAARILGAGLLTWGASILLTGLGN